MARLISVAVLEEEGLKMIMVPPPYCTVHTCSNVPLQCVVYLLVMMKVTLQYQHVLYYNLPSLL